LEWVLLEELLMEKMTANESAAMSEKKWELPLELPSDWTWGTVSELTWEAMSQQQ
jgi:hypothetical protein